jgi:hypothetical protein
LRRAAWNPSQDRRLSHLACHTSRGVPRHGTKRKPPEPARGSTRKRRGAYSKVEGLEYPKYRVPWTPCAAHPLHVSLLPPYLLELSRARRRAFPASAGDCGRDGEAISTSQSTNGDGDFLGGACPLTVLHPSGGRRNTHA